MSKEEFRYPGNKFRDFSTVLGMIADGNGNRVVVQPEQWRHSKCYGRGRISNLKHYLIVTLHKPDGSVAFSYRDFCFGAQERSLSNDQQEYADLIFRHATAVALRINDLFLGIQVDLMCDNRDEK